MGHRRALAFATTMALVFSAAIVVGPLGSREAQAGPPTPQLLSYGSDSLQTVEPIAATQPGSPLVVLVHGGGFNSNAGLSAQLRPEAQTLVSSGDAVFIVNYSTDSKGNPAFPQEVDDVEAGTRLSIQVASQYDADPSNVTLIGGSAGGNLVANAAEQLGPAVVRNVMTLSGVFDFPQELAYWTSVGGQLGHHHLGYETIALGCKKPKASTCSSAVEDEWSPDLHVTATDCPADWLVFNGSDEVDATPVFQADDMTNALTAAGCQATEVIVSGTRSSWGYWDSIVGQVESAIGG